MDNPKVEQTAAEVKTTTGMDDPKIEQTTAGVDEPKVEQATAGVDDPKVEQTTDGVDDPKVEQTTAGIDEPKVEKTTAGMDKPRVRKTTAGVKNLTSVGAITESNNQTNQQQITTRVYKVKIPAEPAVTDYHLSHSLEGTILEHTTEAPSNNNTRHVLRSVLKDRRDLPATVIEIIESMIKGNIPYNSGPYSVYSIFISDKEFEYMQQYIDFQSDDKYLTWLIMYTHRIKTLYKDEDDDGFEKQLDEYTKVLCLYMCAKSQTQMNDWLLSCVQQIQHILSRWYVGGQSWYMYEEVINLFAVICTMCESDELIEMMNNIVLSQDVKNCKEVTDQLMTTLREPRGNQGQQYPTVFTK